jgi:DivIVA domain-containing protein
MRDEVREVDFAIGLRGYDRAAVDRYVEKVNRLIAELEISSSPEAAIRHALEEVSEETSGLLQRAYETAEEITARSRAKADDRLQQANREAEAVTAAAAREAQETSETTQRETRALRETAARDAQQARATAQREVAEMLAAAEARVRELQHDAETIWRERRRFIEDMSAVAQQQLEIAEAAAARFPHATAEESAPARERVAEKELGAADEPTAALPERP